MSRVRRASPPERDMAPGRALRQGAGPQVPVEQAAPRGPRACKDQGPGALLVPAGTGHAAPTDRALRRIAPAVGPNRVRETSVRPSGEPIRMLQRGEAGAVAVVSASLHHLPARGVPSRMATTQANRCGARLGSGEGPCQRPRFRHCFRQVGASTQSVRKGGGRWVAAGRLARIVRLAPNCNRLR